MADVLQNQMDDISAREKYFETLRPTQHLLPEKDLLLAILQDAIDTYRKYRRARDREGKKQFRETEEWIMEGADDWIFSFNNICELLGLDADYLRRGLREAGQERGSAQAKE